MTQTVLEAVQAVGGVTILAQQIVGMGVKALATCAVKMVVDQAVQRLVDELVVNPLAAAAGIDANYIRAGMMAYQFYRLKNPLCFAAGTLVHAERGLVPIEQLERGERVWSYDVENGRWELRQVLSRHRRPYEGPMVEVLAGGQTLRATAGHPFWVAAGDGLRDRPEVDELFDGNLWLTLQGRWVHATDLRTGDRLQCRHCNNVVASEVRRTDGTGCLVYNLTVDGAHNYSVGTAGLLVHNQNCRVVTLDRTRSPQAVQHLEDAGVVGKELPVNRAAAVANRRDALRGRTTSPDTDLDEAPPAVLRAPGNPVSVRAIPRGDNRSAGATLGNQLRGVPDGSRAIIRVSG